MPLTFGPRLSSRPRERPIACAARSPLCAERRALRLDVGAVHGGALRDRTCLHQRVEQFEPETSKRPAIEPTVDRRRRPVVGRAIAPATADLENMQDAGNHAPRHGLVLRQMRFGRRLRRIRQPEKRHTPTPVIHAPVNQEHHIRSNR